MTMLITAAAFIWGVPITLLIVFGVAAIVSPRARAYLGRHLIAE